MSKIEIHHTHDGKRVWATMEEEDGCVVSAPPYPTEEQAIQAVRDPNGFRLHRVTIHGHLLIIGPQARVDGVLSRPPYLGIGYLKTDGTVIYEEVFDTVKAVKLDFARFLRKT